MSHSDNWLA